MSNLFLPVCLGPPPSVLPQKSVMSFWECLLHFRVYLISSPLSQAVQSVKALLISSFLSKSPTGSAKPNLQLISLTAV